MIFDVLNSKTHVGMFSGSTLIMFILCSNGYSLRGHHKVVIPRPTSSYMQHSFKYQASKQWNNLPDKIRMSESLSTFRKNLQDIALSSSYDCNCMFSKYLDSLPTDIFFYQIIDYFNRLSSILVDLIFYFLFIAFIHLKLCKLPCCDF